MSQSLIKLMSTESVMLSNHLILCCPFFSWPWSFPASGSFPMNWLFASGGESIGASASAHQMNIQHWFHLELTGLISMQPKEVSRVFSSTTVWKQQFFSAQPSLWSNSHIHNMTTGETIALTILLSLVSQCWVSSQPFHSRLSASRDSLFLLTFCH